MVFFGIRHDQIAEIKKEIRVPRYPTERRCPLPAVQTLAVPYDRKGSSKNVGPADHGNG